MIIRTLLHRLVHEVSVSAPRRQLTKQLHLSDRQLSVMLSRELSLRKQSLIALRGHGKTIWKTLILPVEDFVVTASSDMKVRVFGTQNGGTLLFTFTGHSSSVRSLETLGGDLVASGDLSGVLCVWRAKSGTCIFTKNLYSGAIWTIAALEQPRFIVGTNAGNLMLWKHVNGEKVVSICVVVDDMKAEIFALAFRGQRLLSGLGDGTAVVRESSGSLTELAILHGHEKAVIGVAISQSGSRFATADGTYTSAGNLTSSGEVSIWDANTNARICNIDSDFLKNVLSRISFVGDSHILTASREKSIDLTEVATKSSVKFRLPFQARDVTLAEDNRMSACGVIVRGETDGSSVHACVFRSPFAINLDGSARDVPVQASPGSAHLASLIAMEPEKLPDTAQSPAESHEVTVDHTEVRCSPHIAGASGNGSERAEENRAQLTKLSMTIMADKSLNNAQKIGLLVFNQVPSNVISALMVPSDPEPVNGGES